GIYDKTFHKRFSLSRAEEHVGHFLSLVDVYSREHHSLDWYASKMCLSTQYMANIVKQVTSKSAGEHIYENLIRQARTLLLSTNMSVQGIADRLGFQNQSHFGTFFRRAVGVSPKAFRTGGE
ncbi:MAG: AraC family transcriptional regulator, partial [Bacteroidales bacterium]|nr:AraC family transcriptional regulator [Bacteroidales bacterium]